MSKTDKKRRRLGWVCLLLACWPVAGWPDFDAGFAAYQSGDYATAFREFRALAEQGDARAQYNVGHMYTNGYGVEQHYAEAAEWYRKAAEQGYANAQLALGVRYAGGLGVAQDDEEAIRWFRMAAEQGDAHAQYKLGQIYRRGQGVAKDHLQAYVWFSAAANAGMQKAASKRDIVARHMTPSQIEAVKKLNRALVTENTSRPESAPANQPLRAERRQ